MPYRSTTTIIMSSCQHMSDEHVVLELGGKAGEKISIKNPDEEKEKGYI